MTFEVTDHVPGLSDEHVSAMADEAASGYVLSPQTDEPNPHFEQLRLVPEDFLDAIDKRAQKDGQSAEAVVRQALAAYLHTA